MGWLCLFVGRQFLVFTKYRQFRYNSSEGEMVVSLVIRRLGLFGLILVLCLAVASPSAAAVRMAAEPLDVPPAQLPTVDRDVLNFYQDQGYSLLNVFEAAELSHDFGLTMDEVFSLFHDRGSFRQVKRYLAQEEEVAAYVPTNRCTFGGWVGEDGQTLKADPKTGTTVDEICTWMLKGYGMEDVNNAFSISATHQATVEELLNLRKQGKDWTEILNAVPFTERAFAEVTGLSVEQLRQMVKQRFTQNEIHHAVYEAEQRYQTVEAVLQEFDEKGRDWNAYLVNNPPPDLLAISLNLPLERVVELVQKGAKPLWILIAAGAAKTEGLAFEMVVDDMIKHNGRRTIVDYEKNAKLPEKDPQSYEELRKLLGLPASTQVTFATGVLKKLGAMGFYGDEPAKIGLIAKAFQLSALDVAAMKKPGMSWLDLIDQLKK